MYLRDFQITMRVHDFALYKCAREIWEPFELRIYRRIPNKFLFGGAKKIVINVGPEPGSDPYQLLLDVGVFHYPDFDMQAFLLASSRDQVLCLTSLVRASFRQLSERFDTPIPWLFEELLRIEAELA